MNHEDLYENQMLVVKDIDRIVNSLYLNCEKEEMRLLNNGCWLEVDSIDGWGYFNIVSPFGEYVIELSPDCLKYLQPAPKSTINIKKLIENIEMFNAKNTINKLLDEKDYETLRLFIDANAELLYEKESTKD